MVGGPTVGETGAAERLVDWACQGGGRGLRLNRTMSGVVVQGVVVVARLLRPWPEQQSTVLVGCVCVPGLRQGCAVEAQ